MFVLSGYETDYENVILSELNDYFQFQGNGKQMMTSITTELRRKSRIRMVEYKKKHYYVSYLVQEMIFKITNLFFTMS